MRLLIFLLLFVNSIYSIKWNFQKDTDSIEQNSQASFKTYIINNSSKEVSIAITKRFISNANNFTSSFCVGETCFPPFLDSITSLDFGNIAPNDSIELDIDLNSSTTGSSNLLVNIINLENSSELYSHNFITSVKNSSILNSTKKDFSIRVYPNPFNPIVNIDINSIGKSSVAIYNINGKLIKNLYNGYISGNKKLCWNAKNLSSGLYILKISTNNITQTKTLNLIK